MAEPEPTTSVTPAPEPAFALAPIQQVWPHVAVYLENKGYEWASLVRASVPVAVQDHRIQIECASEADALVASADHRSDAIGRALLACLQEAFGEAAALESEGCCWELSFTSREPELEPELI